MDYYSKARTNYFTPKDRDAFEEDLRRYLIADDVEIVSARADSGHPADSIAVLMENGAPYVNPDFILEQWDENNPGVPAPAAEDIPSDIVDLLIPHLRDDQVLIYVTIGSEGMRYLDGYACAVNSAGERVTIDTTTITDLAREAFGPDVTITDPSY